MTMASKYILVSFLNAQYSPSLNGHSLCHHLHVYLYILNARIMYNDRHTMGAHFCLKLQSSGQVVLYHDLQ